ncbi:ABC transporter family protein [Culex quinquefasciatus]|uniref:ABC transporter family protein n=1 Tax=Culex quinquefasciatus TaxID=7176 RepID=B0X150_CULQU|nr:ABC transporter family protein [Culex quinquefasciatus]|eukprot:XP_001863372.1 ABC transporter family protein [Culex quinquefasciatus]
MAPSGSDPCEVAIPLLDLTTVLSFKSLNYVVHQSSASKTLLNNVSGSFQSGRLTAIIGPSGAGKSSLLNVLSGFKTKGVKGDILVNNEVIDRQHYRKMVSYNVQNVSLLPNITVEETLRYTADLKMSSKVPDMKKSATINGIIALLGLEKCTKTQARLLSGGERKRLSIGLDLVSDPRILFFDEPTSGLDSVSSYQVISYMKDLAKQGRCVISVIHQPSSELLELFDDVYLVTSGQCLYRGSLADLIPSLSDAGYVCPQYYNPVDFDIQPPNQSSTERHDQYVSRSQYPISRWRQFSILTRRTTLGTVRSITLTVLRITGHLGMGLLIGAIYYNIGNDGAKILSNLGFILLSILFIAFVNGMSSVLTCKHQSIPNLNLKSSSPFPPAVPLEMSVFIREYKSNSYSIVAYLFSKVVADFPMLLTSITLFHVAAYYLTGQINEPLRELTFWAMCVLSGWFAQVYGLLGGSIFPIEVSPLVLPILMLPGIIFCGFFIRYDELSLAFRWFTWVSPFRFTFEAATLGMYGFGREKLECSEIFCYLQKPAKILDMLDMVDACAAVFKLEEKVTIGKKLVRLYFINFNNWPNN